MRSLIILSLALILVAGLSGCSSAYRTGQTPDDVYYSPTREVASYATVDNDRRNGSRYNNRNSGYDDQHYDDYWLRMRVRNRYRWSAFDDYGWNDYGYNSWNSWGYNNSFGSYGYYSPFSYNSYWNNYYYWNSWYNPYCGGIIVVNPKNNPVVYNKVRNFSLAGYNNNTYSTSNRSGNFRMQSSRSGYNNSNGSYGTGNNNRRINNSNSGSRESYYSPTSDRPTRSYSPSSSSSNSGGYSPSSSSSSSSRSGGGSSGGSSGGGGGSSPSRPSRGN